MLDSFEEFKQKVKDANDIVSVVSKYQTLNRKGKHGGQTVRSTTKKHQVLLLMVLSNITIVLVAVLVVIFLLSFSIWKVVTFLML